MAEAQRAYGDGYVGALPPLELATLRGFKEGKIEPKDPFSFANGAWVPWYTQHKVSAVSGVARRFEHAAILGPLRSGRDELAGDE
jgi:hypothetical protein